MTKQIFVTGKYGVGKTTFIKGLFSGKVEAAIGVRSTNIRSYTFEKKEESLVVYDTLGQELNSTSLGTIPFPLFPVALGRERVWNKLECICCQWHQVCTCRPPIEIPTSRLQ